MISVLRWREKAERLFKYAQRCSSALRLIRSARNAIAAALAADPARALPLSRSSSNKTQEVAARTHTFLQVGDAVVQRGERGLHFVPLLAVVPGGAFGLLQRVDAGQNLLLHVIYLVLQQVFEAIGLRRVVASTVLLRETEDRRTLSLRINFSVSNVRRCSDVCRMYLIEFARHFPL